MPASASASSYQPGRPRRTASSSTASRPTCCSTTSAGTLPLRKPGTRISRPSWDAAVFSSRSSASVGTSTSTRTRESGSSVVLVFTAAVIGPVTVAALTCPAVRRTPVEKLQAWVVTGPLGHLWSALADMTLIWVRYLAHRARGG